jgi:parallel beta-helix repeat protein
MEKKSARALLTNSSYNSVNNNSCQDIAIGIALSNSSYTNITNNSCLSNTFAGISIDESHNSIIQAVPQLNQSSPM